MMETLPVTAIIDWNEAVGTEVGRVVDFVDGESDAVSLIGVLAI